MMTLGRDVSSLFPHVVKNVVVDSMEVKKLVYMYVVHYAAQNSDLALLAISSFQKDMASPNPLVRAKALHAMASMRVDTVAHLIIIQLQNAVKDSSSYVRRTAAHCLPVVLDLTPKSRTDMIPMIRSLLEDDSVFGLVGALYAYSRVCPNEWSLIHPHYRKICHLLADMDEWGQSLALEILLKYVRNQFTSPFKSSSTDGDGGDEDDQKTKDSETGEDKKRDDDDNDDDGAENDDEQGGGRSSKSGGKKERHNSLDDLFATPNLGSKSSDGFFGSSADGRGKGSGSGGRGGTFTDDGVSLMELDSDHVLAIECCKNLIFSMNPSVVLGVVNLLWYCAPREECIIACKALIKFVDGPREIAYCTLANISTMCQSRPEIFSPFWRHFFIQSFEPVWIKELKLDILSMVANESNISQILREFMAYTKDTLDVKFRCATIEAMGRCASSVPEVADNVMRALMRIVSEEEGNNAGGLIISMSRTAGQSGSSSSSASSSSSSSSSSASGSSSSATGASSSPSTVTSVARSQASGVVASAVVVIRQIIQRDPSRYKKSMLSLLRLLNKTTVAEARCAIVWIIGEYRQYISEYAPDALRLCAQSFVKESDEVKMQILNLAVKVYLSNAAQTGKLFKYILDLCKYDLNYDLRDRARLIRSVFFQKKKKKSGDSSSSALTSKEEGLVSKSLRTAMQEMFLAPKQIPEIVSPFQDRDRFVMGSLAHLVIHNTGDSYQALEDWPDVAPDTRSLRSPPEVSPFGLKTKDYNSDENSEDVDLDDIVNYTSDESDFEDEEESSYEGEEDDDSFEDDEEEDMEDDDEDEDDESGFTSSEDEMVVSKTRKKQAKKGKKTAGNKRKRRDDSDEESEDWSDDSKEESEEELPESEDESSSDEIDVLVGQSASVSTAKSTTKQKSPPASTTTTSSKSKGKKGSPSKKKGRSEEEEESSDFSDSDEDEPADSTTTAPPSASKSGGVSSSAGGGGMDLLDFMSGFGGAPSANTSASSVNPPGSSSATAASSASVESSSAAAAPDFLSSMFGSAPATSVSSAVSAPTSGENPTNSGDGSNNNNNLPGMSTSLTGPTASSGSIFDEVVEEYKHTHSRFADA